uniref:Uncharacterized protein n=1 Tax=Zea mays TaxID=4577 RepID=A0A804PTN7_MAIZE
MLGEGAPGPCRPCQVTGPICRGLYCRSPPSSRSAALLVVSTSLIVYAQAHTVGVPAQAPLPGVLVPEVLLGSDAGHPCHPCDTYKRLEEHSPAVRFDSLLCGSGGGLTAPRPLPEGCCVC